MAKKKNSQKKHTFKHVASHETATQTAGVTATNTEAPKAAAARPATANGTTVRDFSYVAGDMKRIGIIAASLIALEVVLYFVLTHTSAGTTIYNLVKV